MNDSYDCTGNAICSSWNWSLKPGATCLGSWKEPEIAKVRSRLTCLLLDDYMLFAICYCWSVYWCWCNNNVKKKKTKFYIFFSLTVCLLCLAYIKPMMLLSSIPWLDQKQFVFVDCCLTALYLKFSCLFFHPNISI